MTGNPLLRSDGIAEIRAVAGRISDVDDHVTVHQAAAEIERLRAALTDTRREAFGEAAKLADEKAAWCLSQRSGCKEGVTAWNAWTRLMVQAMSLADSIRALQAPK